MRWLRRRARWDWRELIAGTSTGDLTAAAVFDVEVQDGEPGDARVVAFAWPPDGRPQVADNDILAGDDGTVIAQEVEEVDEAGWRLTGLGEVWASGNVPGIGDVVADAAPMRLRHAFGPGAGGVPAEGWIAAAHRDGGDPGETWWVILDEQGTPRRAFAATSDARAR